MKRVFPQSSRSKASLLRDQHPEPTAEAGMPASATPSLAAPPRRLTRRRLLKHTMRGLLGATLAGGTGWSYAHFIEPNWVELTSLSLALPRLAAPFQRYRLVQLSDLHLGDWLDAAHLQDVITTVNQQQPDLVAITGDFVTFDPAAVAADLVTQLRRLQARDGVVAVLGNHDHWSDANRVRQVLQQSGVIELRNTAITLERGGEALHLAGVDDIWAQQDRLDRVLTRLPDQGAAILLAHEPDFADTSAATGRFDLQLSGHSHGGQVRLPLLGALQLPPYGRKYPMGLYQIGDMLLYTNRGVGMLAPHYRFNCRPEITVFTLEQKNT